jgi:hypothetical protein
MNITESQLRSIVREMLAEAVVEIPGTDPSTVAFDPYLRRARDTRSDEDVDTRMRKMAPKMRAQFTPYVASDKVVTAKNATTDQSVAMSAYLNWYGLATGRSDQAPWLDVAIGTSWPTAALMQFQKEQALLVDGRMGKQTATYIMSGGRIRKAPPGMKLEDADKVARGILDAEKILAKAGIKQGAESYVKNPPQQIFKAQDFTPAQAGRGYANIGKPAPTAAATAAANLTPGGRMKVPSLSDRGQMGGYGGAATFDMPRVRK